MMIWLTFLAEIRSEWREERNEAERQAATAAAKSQK